MCNLLHFAHFGEIEPDKLYLKSLFFKILINK